ncbi:MAG: SUMF1/EgtB/PvdO family nonheme iron enzyme, partial [Candidatus Taylorbacteria bacterium]
TAGQTSPVGSFPDSNSPYGVQDMSGNVWEWCDSWYKDNNTRVVRGGSWVTSIPNFFCAAFRLNYNPTYGDIHYGFRCILRSPEL